MFIMWFSSLIMLPLGLLFTSLLKKTRGWLFIPLTVVVIATIFAFVTALKLQDLLPVKLDEITFEEVGLTTWRLIYRHLTSVFAGMLTAFAGVLHLIENFKVRARQKEEEYKPVFDLGDNTLDLEMEELPGAVSAHKPKRSQRHKQNKK